MNLKEMQAWFEGFEAGLKNRSLGPEDFKKISEMIKSVKSDDIYSNLDTFKTAEGHLLNERRKV